MQLLGHSIEKKKFTQHLSEITGLEAILGGPSLFANIGSQERMPSNFAKMLSKIFFFDAVSKELHVSLSNVKNGIEKEKTKALAAAK